MRYLVIYCLCAIIACTSKPTTEAQVNPDPSTQTTFDSTKAKSWGADDYGMKSYVLVFLKSGPYRPQDSTTRTQLQAAHMANINRLAAQGSLIMAGPMMTDEDIRGIYLFDVRTIEEARKLTETDPAIQAGSLIMEMHPWYSSAALMEIPRLHKVGAKKGM